MPIQMHKDSTKTSAFWRSALDMSVVDAKVNVGQVVIRPYGNASYPSRAGCNVQNLYQHLRSSKNFRNCHLPHQYEWCKFSVRSMLESWLVLQYFFLTGIFFSFSSSYLHNTVHSTPAALACEAVHLSATMDMAQTGITSSFLETENVSLLWCVIPWSQHRESALFLPKPVSVGYGRIYMAHMYYSMGSWNVFVIGSEMFIVSPCFQMVWYVKENLPPQTGLCQRH